MYRQNLSGPQKGLFILLLINYEILYIHILIHGLSD